MITTPKNIQEEINKAQKNLEKLLLQKKIFDNYTEAQKLATILHEKLCVQNHTDGCDWFYFDDKNKYGKNWERNYSHNHYLGMARNMLLIANFETCCKIVECLKS